MKARPGVAAGDACGDAAGLREAALWAGSGASSPGGHAPALALRLDSSTIVLWRGYRYFEFCAVAADGTLLKRSTGFLRRSREPAESHGAALRTRR